MKTLKQLRLKDLENKLYLACDSTGDENGKVASDFALDGDIRFLRAALLIQMQRHPLLAVIITNCAIDYKNGKGRE
jgi:hypothetical protein